MGRKTPCSDEERSVMSETQTPWKRRPLRIIQCVISFGEIIGNFIFTLMCLDSAGAYFPKAFLRFSRIHIGTSSLRCQLSFLVSSSHDCLRQHCDQRLVITAWLSFPRVIPRQSVLKHTQTVQCTTREHVSFSTSDREGRYSPHSRCMDGWTDKIDR